LLGAENGLPSRAAVRGPLLPRPIIHRPRPNARLREPFFSTLLESNPACKRHENARKPSQIAAIATGIVRRSNVSALKYCTEIPRIN
jgi:hypothetical protein